MAQVFKTKWVPDWQYVGMGVAILVVIVIFFWLQEWIYFPWENGGSDRVI